jgi:hypothetical protein
MPQEISKNLGTKKIWIHVILTKIGRDHTNVCPKQPSGEVTKHVDCEVESVREMVALHEDMDRLFSRLDAGARVNGMSSGGQNWMLAMDVVETEDAIKLKASVPGIEPENIQIQVEDNCSPSVASAVSRTKSKTANTPGWSSATEHLAAR